MNTNTSRAPWTRSTSNFGSIVDADGKSVCEGLKWNDNALGNAALIVAAPDLFDALDAIVGMCNADIPDRLLKDAKSAMAKAKGGEA